MGETVVHYHIDSETIRKSEMKNVEMTVTGTTLTIKVDLSKEFGLSASKKSIIIASTEGNMSIEGAEDKKIGLNIYKKPPQE